MAYSLRSESYPDASGVALIINIAKFENEVLQPRVGAHHDDKSLRDVFELLRFKIEQKNDCTKEKFIHNVHLAMNSLVGVDGPFFLCIMSHGNNEGVHFADGEILSTREILHLFTEDECKQLVGKPKIVIIQACRGKQMLAVQNGSVQLVTYSPDSSSCTMAVVDRRADTLVFRSCVENRVAFRSDMVGSRFITTLCSLILDQLKTSGRFDFVDVARLVIATMHDNLVQIGNRPAFCTPEITNNTLRKKLYISMPDPKSQRTQQLLESATNRIKRFMSLMGTKAPAKLQVDGAAGCKCVNSGCKPHTKCLCQREGRACTPKCRCLQVEQIMCTNGKAVADSALLPTPPIASTVPSAALGCRCVNSGCKPNTKCACQREGRACTPKCRCLQNENTLCTNGNGQDSKRSEVQPTRASTSANLGCRCVNSGCKPHTKCLCQRRGSTCTPQCRCLQVEDIKCTNGKAEDPEGQSTPPRASTVPSPAECTTTTDKRPCKSERDSKDGSNKAERDINSGSSSDEET